jgi:hypothetical protein
MKPAQEKVAASPGHCSPHRNRIDCGLFCGRQKTAIKAALGMAGNGLCYQRQTLSSMADFNDIDPIQGFEDARAIS